MNPDSVNDQGADASESVGILVFDGVEVLDFAGPFEVFSVTRRSESDRAETASPCPPVLIAPNAGRVRATGGMDIEVPFAPDGAPPLRALVVPGGRGVRALLNDDVIRDWLRMMAGQVEVLMSVCTGAGLLASSGLLAGHRVTTHHRYLDWLAELEPNCRVVSGQRFVDEGALITAGGISAGIDAALHLVARWEGEAVADATASYMEYQRFQQETDKYKKVT